MIKHCSLRTENTHELSDENRSNRRDKHRPDRLGGEDGSVGRLESENLSANVFQLTKVTQVLVDILVAFEHFRWCCA